MRKRTTPAVNVAADKAVLDGLSELFFAYEAAGRAQDENEQRNAQFALQSAIIEAARQFPRRSDFEDWLEAAAPWISRDGSRSRPRSIPDHAVVDTAVRLRRAHRRIARSPRSPSPRITSGRQDATR